MIAVRIEQLSHTFIHRATAIVVDLITDLRSTRIDGRVKIVAVVSVLYQSGAGFAGLLGLVRVAKSISVIVCIQNELHTLIDFTVTVVVNPVTGFQGSAVYQGIVVVTIVFTFSIMYWPERNIIDSIMVHDY